MSQERKTPLWNFWIDRGGTFTDIVARQDGRGGKTFALKMLSENPEQYEDAAVAGIAQFLAEHGGRVGEVKMGTTVATNALLQRNGEPTLLLATAGFEDLPRIGNQSRPNLFDLSAARPPPLFARVAGAQERINAAGKVEKPLNQAHALRALRGARKAGIRAVAIAFMHSHLNPAHELAAARLAKRAGFAQISLGHVANPLQKYLPRQDTATADACLTPVLRRHLQSASRALARAGCKRFLLMRSDGGLSEAARFAGKDAILSGPAGGVVGMAQTARALGFKKVIGFDMGGTSTDVCHYDGEYERRFETEINGARIRAPMLEIHTVAAGGGSIARFANGRYVVGPQSAGANPGPACYRRGGPLTITDCNLALGRLQAGRFPSVFGKRGNLPPSVAAARARLAQTAKRIAAATGKKKPPPLEEVAAGFLRVAAQNMASAIKKISTQRGRDVAAGYALNSFGGAGGGHACMVADALSIRRIVLHPLAGVLSALGMQYAPARATREAPFARPLTAASLPAMRRALARLQKLALAEAKAQGAGKCAVVLRARLRNEGGLAVFDVPAGGGVAAMQKSFNAAHRKRFGFVGEARQIVIESLEAQAGDGGGKPARVAPPQKTQTAKAAERVSAFADGKRQQTRLYVRANLRAGDVIAGPAIVCGSNDTVFIERRWRAVVWANGALVLAKQGGARREKIAVGKDPAFLEIFNNLLMSIGEQMGAALANTAYSVNIKERLDFSCAIFDSNGDLIANAPHVPVHLGSMSETARATMAANPNMRPGDSFMSNSPYRGGTHLPDITVITPVFAAGGGGKPLFYVGSRGHHADVGGIAPGSTPPASANINEEGVIIENCKIASGGRFLRAQALRALTAGAYPSRQPQNNLADLEAQMAANHLGATELQNLTRRFGLPVVNAYMRHVCQNAEECARRAVANMRGGKFVCPLESGGRVAVEAKINRVRRQLTLNFAGTSPQHAGNWNAPPGIVRAVALYVLRCFCADSIPLNDGCLRAARLLVPPASMLSPQYPAAVIAGNTEVSQAIADCLLAALGAQAASQGTMNNFSWGNAQFQNYETFCGGGGGGNGFVGASATHTNMTNTRMTDPEVLEARFPVVVEEVSIRRNSGGGGKFAGGDGMVRKLRFLRPVAVSFLCGRRRFAPFGLRGGKAGKAGINMMIRANGRREVLPGCAQTQARAGDVAVVCTPGGGGFGKSRP